MAKHVMTTLGKAFARAQTARDRIEMTAINKLLSVAGQKRVGRQPARRRRRAAKRG